MRRNSGLAVAVALAMAVSAKAEALTIYAVTNSNALVTFDSATPGTIGSSVAISGLVGLNEAIVGIDFRPATGQLYGLGSGSRLYLINPGTGAATQVGLDAAFSLNGSSFGFDFNPVPDRIRVTSDADQNLRLNPNDGTLTMADGTLAYAGGDANVGVNPNIVGSAYTNSFAPSPRTPPPGTTLYGIDSTLDILVIQNPPNDGVLNTVGALGIDTSDMVGFDIFSTDPATNLAFASLTSDGISSLYSINLGTGAASGIGGIGNDLLIRDIAVAPISEPGTAALLLTGLAALWARRRKS